MDVNVSLSTCTINAPLNIVTYRPIFNRVSIVVWPFNAPGKVYCCSFVYHTTNDALENTFGSNISNKYICTSNTILQ